MASNAGGCTRQAPQRIALAVMAIGMAHCTHRRGRNEKYCRRHAWHKDSLPPSPHSAQEVGRLCRSQRGSCNRRCVARRKNFIEIYLVQVRKLKVLRQPCAALRDYRGMPRVLLLALLPLRPSIRAGFAPQAANSTKLAAIISPCEPVSFRSRLFLYRFPDVSAHT